MHQFSHAVVSDSLQPNGLLHAKSPCPSLIPGVSHTHLHRVSDAIQPPHFHLTFTSRLQSFPASGSFLFFFKFIVYIYFIPWFMMGFNFLFIFQILEIYRLLTYRLSFFLISEFKVMNFYFILLI